MIVKLIYAPKVVEKPVLAEVILKTGVPINILEAKVNAQKGELIVSIPAKGKLLEKIFGLFNEFGVSAQKFTKILQIDYDKCTSCGACISPCPTKALRFKLDWTIEFIEKKCIACKTCVTTCPVKAIVIP